MARYPSNTGYAWESIERLFARIGDRLAQSGRETFVAYPRINGPPGTLNGSACRPVVLDATLRTARSLRQVLAFVRRHRIRVVYFGDSAAWHWKFVLLRLAGARHIVVHVRTYDDTARHRWSRRLARRIGWLAPAFHADAVIAVSEYVAGHLADVRGVPRRRLRTISNGLPPVSPEEFDRSRLRRELGLEPDRAIVLCACRASTEKGVAVLLRAFDRVARSFGPEIPRPALLYAGNGPQFAELETIRASLASKDAILMLGYRSDVGRLIHVADLCVVPSLREAFGLFALEAMARGKAVIATRVGGLPEIVEDGRSGLLVPAMDERAMADAIISLLHDAALRQRLGDAARQRVESQFTLERQIAGIAAVVEEGFDGEAHAAQRGRVG